MKKIMLLALVLTTACIGVKRAVLVDLSDSPVPPEEVTIFLPDDNIPEDCERMALLAAAGDLGRDFGDLLQKLREEAGELGANALDIQFMSEAGSWDRMGPRETGNAGYLRWARQGRDMRAFALYCLGGTAPVRQATTGPGSAKRQPGRQGARHS